MNSFLFLYLLFWFCFYWNIIFCTWKLLTQKQTGVIFTALVFSKCHAQELHRFILKLPVRIAAFWNAQENCLWEYASEDCYPTDFITLKLQSETVLSFCFILHIFAYKLKQVSQISNMIKKILINAQLNAFWCKNGGFPTNSDNPKEKKITSSFTNTFWAFLVHICKNLSGNSW